MSPEKMDSLFFEAVEWSLSLIIRSVRTGDLFRLMWVYQTLRVDLIGAVRTNPEYASIVREIIDSIERLGFADNPLEAAITLRTASMSRLYRTIVASPATTKNVNQSGSDTER